jgi:ABC-type branched-subunit amino acid transport system substrate-binding protein
MEASHAAGDPVTNQRMAADGPTGRPRRRPMGLLATAALLAATLAGCSGSSPGTSSSSPTANGPKTSNGPAQVIKVGSIATRNGLGASDFVAFIPGMQAYFDMVNAEGGVSGHKFQFAYDLDDGGSPTTFDQLAHTLIQQDGAFAAFISTFWFSPNLFVSTGIPTYGYNVSGNWAGPDNLFAAGGSIQDYHALAPPVAYLIKQTHASSVAIISYGQGIPASYPACKTTADDLTAGGIKVSYLDLAASLGGDFTAPAQQILSHGSDFVLTCIQDSDNISLARAMQQYGVHAHQLWLSGYNQALLDQYRDLMQGVYVDANGFVPFSAPTSFPGVYPGMEHYLSAMRKYEPNYVTNQLAMQGWQSAALLAAGVARAGANVTRQNVIQQTNGITNFTAGGITALVNWTTAHNTQSFPICPSFVQVKGNQFLPALGQGRQVFICFNEKVDLKNPVLATPPPGTPGT